MENLTKQEKTELIASGGQLIGLKIKLIRILNGWTQTELGALIDMKQPSIARIESTNKISGETIEKIKRVFKLNFI